MGDDAISFSTASIAGRAASACEPVPQSIKARIQTGDVNTDTQNIALAEFEGQLRNILRELGLELPRCARDQPWIVPPYRAGCAPAPVTGCASGVAGCG